jgi:hypothetical protein
VWIGGKLSAKTVQDSLPTLFSQTVTLYAAERLTIHEVAQKIQQASGLNVKLGSEFAKISKSAGPPTMVLSFTGTLSQLLDTVANRFDANWDWSDQSINLSRLVTRSFTLKSNPGDTSYSTSLGRESSGSGGANSGGASGGSVGTGGGTFSATTKTEMKVGFSPWTDIEGQIKSVLSIHRYHFGYR